jgi:hypothetical protein
LKIIDFDRGIGQIKLPGMKEGKMFMSDQFHYEEEADYLEKVTLY